ncbi:uncharacterized protein [Macrobrachium rosenbergii]|uniref:uncharacterized protein n=1 Tax=Macrobrachium rosenbergii TaxID=79674 RepID=UPI0034D62669
MKEELISAVHRRQPIWDPRHHQHKDRNVIKKLWVEIGSELEFNDINELRSKWRGMRDYYVKELKKIPKPRSGNSSSAKTHSSWPHFRQMSFLNDILLTRDRAADIAPSPGQNDSEVDAHHSSEKYPSDTRHGRTTRNDRVLDEPQLERNESPGPSQIMPQDDDDDDDEEEEEEGARKVQKEFVPNSKQVLQQCACSSSGRKRTAKRKLDDDYRKELITLESKNSNYWQRKCMKMMKICSISGVCCRTSGHCPEIGRCF